MIDYVPKDWLIESKALKFFLASFRRTSPAIG
jgi:NADPH-dependent 7-cyano-7-deazaguanine reductase QueF